MKRKTTKKNTFVNSVLSVFANNPFKSYNFRQLSYTMGISDKVSKQLVKEILVDLALSNAIIELKRGKYQLSPSKISRKWSNAMITGIVDMKQTGKAYIITDDMSEDVFIASNNTHHALDGDKVKVHIFPKRKGRKTEGQIIEIIQRIKKQFVGIVQASKKYAFLIPDNTSITVDIYIPISNLNGAKNGQKAIARITDWPKLSNNPFGEIIEILGEPGDNDVEMNSILAAFDFPINFPEHVIKESQKIKNIVTPSQIKIRKDFRDVFTCTIDPEDAKDFDDALSLKKLRNGNWEVGIHIADVSFYVKPDSVIDKEAFERGTSIYLVDRVIPMLPEQLSNIVCSLRPDEEKLCFSAVFEMNEDAKIINEWFGKTVIKSKRRYNYDEVQKIIEGGNDVYKDELIELYKLAYKLKIHLFFCKVNLFNSNTYSIT